jgi:hypothetical protein
MREVVIHIWWIVVAMGMTVGTVLALGVCWIGHRSSR